jgi:hypothetical protein
MTVPQPNHPTAGAGGASGIIRRMPTQDHYNRATQAVAQYGADQELEAVLDYLQEWLTPGKSITSAPSAARSRRA